MEIYRPKHFQLYELVPQVVYEYADHNKIWECFDPHLLWTADKLREIYGTVNVNTWWWGGNTQYRGWRPKTPPIGERWAEWTMHAWFRALDMVFKHVTAEEVRQDIKADKWPVVFQHIRCIEDGVSWLHIDTRNYDGLLIVTP